MSVFRSLSSAPTHPRFVAIWDRCCGLIPYCIHCTINQLLVMVQLKTSTVKSLQCYSFNVHPKRMFLETVFLSTQMVGAMMSHRMMGWSNIARCSGVTGGSSAAKGKAKDRIDPHNYSGSFSQIPPKYLVAAHVWKTRHGGTRVLKTFVSQNWDCPTGMLGVCGLIWKYTHCVISPSYPHHVRCHCETVRIRVYSPDCLCLNDQSGNQRIAVTFS